MKHMLAKIGIAIAGFGVNSSHKDDYKTAKNIKKAYKEYLKSPKTRDDAKSLGNKIQKNLVSYDLTVFYRHDCIVIADIAGTFESKVKLGNDRIVFKL